MKTPEQIAAEIADAPHIHGESACYRNSGSIGGGGFLRAVAYAAIMADRAQHRPEIFIVQDDLGGIVDVLSDADEATAAYQDGYTVTEETVWGHGEYAAQRIATLTAEWEAATGDTASNYMLSEDDWKAGLDHEDAAEIARLIDWKKDNA